MIAKLFRDIAAVLLTAFAPSRFGRFSMPWLVCWLALLVFYLPALVLSLFALAWVLVWAAIVAAWRAWTAPKEPPK